MAKQKNSKAQKRELTREDAIAEAKQRYGMASPLSTDLIPPVPDCRVLKVGDRVELGNLQDCVVAELSDDGRFVTVEYNGIDRHGVSIHGERCFSTWAWFDVFPLEQIESTRFTTDRMRPTFIQSDVKSLLSLHFRRGLIDNPDYQRGYVWTLEDKLRLIESVMCERNIGSFLFVQYKYARYEGMLEILDGKQRLNALIEFYTGRFTYRGKFYHQLSRIDRTRFEGARVAYAYLDGENMTRVQLLEMFLEMNCAGVPQTEDHLNKVRELLCAEQAAL